MPHSYSFISMLTPPLGNAWYRAQLNLQDMKIGHYMHVPPRDVFFSQVFGSFLGIPINYAVIRWVLDTKRDYLTGKEIDPTHQWTGQEIASGLTTSAQYVMIVSRWDQPCLDLANTSTGTTPLIRTTYLPSPTARLRLRCSCSSCDLRSPPPIPASQIPALEYNDLLQHNGALLG